VAKRLCSALRLEITENDGHGRARYHALEGEQLLGKTRRGRVTPRPPVSSSGWHVA
jgi:hypothetical protein